MELVGVFQTTLYIDSKMKKMILTMGVSILMLFFIACKCDLSDKSYSIFIDNKSEFVISSYLALGNIGTTAYPDTTLSFEKKHIGYDTKPNNRAYRTLPTLTYVEWFAKLPQDTLSIFIFSKDTLDTYLWEEIRQGYKTLQRYDLSLENLKRLSDENGVPVIVYPPSAVMKDIKMYPPYRGE